MRGQCELLNATEEPSGRPSACHGAVRYCERQARSFGHPFTTHAWACEAHAKLYGYKQAPVPQRTQR